jgi:DNA-binding response OmpR family regulator
VKFRGRQGAAAAARDEIARKKMIVLLVEDDGDLRELLEQVLAPEFEVRGCATGTEALHILTSEPVDLLLTDLDLPGISGEELVAVARGRPRPMGVVVMSGSRKRLDSCRAESDAALIKPFALSTARAALRRAAELALRRRRAQRS